MNRMLTAYKQDYKRAFKKHRATYINWPDKANLFGKRLILVYCVECGLKYLIMDKERINCVLDAREDIQKKLKSHDFQMLLKQLKKVGDFNFPGFNTIYGDTVTPKTYHQICRYTIDSNPKGKACLEEYEKNLENVMKWIDEEGV